MEQIQERILAGETRELPFGPCFWRLLKTEEGRALLITENEIGKRPYHAYHDRFEDITWETCSLRKYLNSDFTEGFSDEEQRLILESNIENPDNPEHGTYGGNPTRDKIFLLSIYEAKDLFLKDGGWTEAFIGDEAWWWLRSPGHNGINAALFSEIDVGSLFGYVSYNGDFVINEYGVRPALWLDLSSDKKEE